jgi:HK97 family phage prohead protease
MLRTKDSAQALMTKNSAIALDVKALGDDGTFEGYGSIFGNVDSYGEVVMPGAFAGSLASARQKGRTVKMLWQHDPERPIGIWNDLSEDGKGLYVKGTLLKDSVAQATEAYALLKAGALDGLSIGYREIEVSPHPDKTGIVQLKKLDLKEVSIVTFAANDRARVTDVKHMLEAGQLPTIREFEGALRELGLSKSKAAACAAACAPHLRGEPEAKADNDAFWKMLGEQLKA